MDLDALGVKIVLGDAYEWLETHKSRFDVVVDDVYTAHDSDVTRPDWSIRHLSLLRDHLKPEGVVVANLITGRGHRRMQTAVRRSFLKAFPVVRKVTTPWSWNEILVGGERVASGKSLVEWGAEFPHPNDRRFWRALEVKKL
jgi:spermidine synthase